MRAAIFVVVDDKKVYEYQKKLLQKHAPFDFVLYIDLDMLSSEDAVCSVRELFLYVLERYKVYTTLPKSLLDPIGRYYSKIIVVDGSEN